MCTVCGFVCVRMCMGVPGDCCLCFYICLGNRGVRNFYSPIIPSHAKSRDHLLTPFPLKDPDTVCTSMYLYNILIISQCLRSYTSLYNCLSFCASRSSVSSVYVFLCACLRLLSS